MQLVVVQWGDGYQAYVTGEALPLAACSWASLIAVYVASRWEFAPS